MVEPLGDPMHHRRLQRVVVQDRGIDEGADLGLAADDVFRLGADARPHRIDLVKGRLGPRLLLRHESSLPDLRPPSSTSRTAPLQSQC